jgi:anti-sigma B factor antagonist
MNLSILREGGTCVVPVSGRITTDSSPDLRTLLFDQLGSLECDTLTVDLYDVSYVDTSGLAVLLETLRSAHNLDKTFNLSGLRGRPRYLLEATRLLHLFREVPRDAPQ